MSSVHFQALAAVATTGAATAVELYLCSDRSIGITGWNNRLQDLCKMGFLRREGKKPVVYRLARPVQ